jgi:hypothetical protein
MDPSSARNDISIILGADLRRELRKHATGNESALGVLNYPETCRFRGPKRRNRCRMKTNGFTKRRGLLLHQVGRLYNGLGLARGARDHGEKRNQNEARIYHGDLLVRKSIMTICIDRIAGKIQDAE